MVMSQVALVPYSSKCPSLAGFSHPLSFLWILRCPPISQYHALM